MTHGSTRISGAGTHFTSASQSSCGPLLLAILILVAQIGPAFACSLFDGDDLNGCPAVFSSVDLGAANHSGNGSPGDCSVGPAFLLCETNALELVQQGDRACATDSAATATLHHAAALAGAPLKVLLPAAIDVRPNLKGTGIYLETRRLRI